MVRRTVISLTMAALVAAAAPSRAQEASKPEPPKPDTGNKEAAGERRGAQNVSLRVQLVISRYQGDRKLASFPYTLVVTPAAGPPFGPTSRMRMGVDTPVPVSSSEGGKQTTSVQYRTVGTNIDCRAREVASGRYLLSIGVENSSALPFEKGPSSGGAPPAVDANPTASPLFRRFDSNIDVVLRDGQTIQTIASTDPVTGEVVKIDVTMNVIP
jgi:hypothetical protein